MLTSIIASLDLKTVLLALCVGLFVHWLIGRLRYKLPPGPMGLPLLGNMLQFDSKILHKQIYKWSLKYGPVVRLQFGPIPMIAINDIDTAMEVLVKKSADFAGRVKLHSLDLLSDGGRSIILSQYGPTWHLHRRIASKALRMYMQGEKLEHRIHEAVETAMTEMKKCTGQPILPADYINYTVGNILIGLCFGGKFSFDDKEIHDLIEKEDEFNNTFNGVVPEDIIPGLNINYDNQGIDLGRHICMPLFETAENVRHLVDYLMLARKEAEKEEEKELLDSLTERHLIQTCSDVFFAGIDTSRLTLGYTFLYMVKYPDIQKKVQEEIDRVVDGYDIPNKTMVIINHWALHHRPDAWEDVDEFKPERFLDDNGKMGPKPKSWLPFSAGKRVCLGEFVAKPELHLVLASLLQRFTWKLAPGAVPDFEGESAFTYVPKPCMVVLEERA